MEHVAALCSGPPSKPTSAMVCAPSRSRVRLRAHEILGKAGAAVDGNQNDHVSFAKQAAHLVHEHVLALGIIRPRCVQRDVVGQTARVERALPRWDDVFSQIAGKMLCGRCRAAVAHRVDAAFLGVAFEQNLAREVQRFAIQLSCSSRLVWSRKSSIFLCMSTPRGW